MTAYPIMLRGPTIFGLRAGTRSHLTLPASFIPKRRTPVGAEARARGTGGALPMPTRWVSLQAGDMLWVKEDVVQLNDNRGTGRAWYRCELLGGHAPIPGGVRKGRYSTRNIDAKDMPREHSRYTLAVDAVRVCRAQELEWADIDGEGPRDPHWSKNLWWDRTYGVVIGPWDENPEVVSVSVKFVDGNIDTGERWKPDAPPSNGGNPALVAALLGGRLPDAD